MNRQVRPADPAQDLDGTPTNEGAPEPGARRRTPAARLWQAAQLAVVAGVVWGVYRALAPEIARLSWADLTRFRPAPLPLVASMLLLVGVYLAHAFLWRRILSDLAVARPTARDTVRVYFLASLGRYLPGKLWQLAGLAVLSSRAGISPAGAAAAAILGQVAFLATGLVFLAFLLPRLFDGSLAVAGGIGLFMVAAFGWMLVASRPGERARAWLLQRLPDRLRQRLAAAFGLAGRIRPALAVTWTAAYGLSWVALGVAFTFFVAAFVPDALQQSRELAGTVAASYLLGYVVLIAPGGIGVREVTMGGLLSQISGFPVAAALLVAVASRIWFTVAEILPLALVPLLPSAAAAAGDEP